MPELLPWFKKSEEKVKGMVTRELSVLYCPKLPFNKITQEK